MSNSSVIIQKHARNFTVMLTAGGNLEEIIEMAKSFGIRAVHFDQLAVPVEEESARLNLIKALKNNGIL